MKITKCFYFEEEVLAKIKSLSDQNGENISKTLSGIILSYNPQNKNQMPPPNIPDIFTRQDARYMLLLIEKFTKEILSTTNIPNLLREEEIKSKIKMLKKQAKDEMTKPKAILMFFRVQ